MAASTMAEFSSPSSASRVVPQLLDLSLLDRGLQKSKMAKKLVGVYQTYAGNLSVQEQHDFIDLLQKPRTLPDMEHPSTQKASSHGIMRRMFRSGTDGGWVQSEITFIRWAFMVTMFPDAPKVFELARAVCGIAGVEKEPCFRRYEAFFPTKLPSVILPAARDVAARLEKQATAEPAVTNKIKILLNTDPYAGSQRGEGLKVEEKATILTYLSRMNPTTPEISGQVKTNHNICAPMVNKRMKVSETSINTREHKLKAPVHSLEATGDIPMTPLASLPGRENDDAIVWPASLSKDDVSDRQLESIKKKAQDTLKRVEYSIRQRQWGKTKDEFEKQLLDHHGRLAKLQEAVRELDEAQKTAQTELASAEQRAQASDIRTDQMGQKIHAIYLRLDELGQSKKGLEQSNYARLAKIEQSCGTLLKEQSNQIDRLQKAIKNEALDTDILKLQLKYIKEQFEAGAAIIRDEIKSSEQRSSQRLDQLERSQEKIERELKVENIDISKWEAVREWLQTGKKRSLEGQ